MTGDGVGRHYDDDPYVGVDWHPDHVYQLDDDGLVDRSVAVRLESPKLARMRDCARITDTPWIPTTGFFPRDNHPARRIDRWYATHHVPDAAVMAQWVADEKMVGLSTDHLPVGIDVDIAALRT